MIELVTRVDELRSHVAGARGAGKTIGLVPTMGALHAGHVSLVEIAQRECGFTVVTIFVNPTQFGPQEDLARYPRTLDADLAALGACRTDLVFAPPADEVYRPGFATWVEPAGVAEPWEGQCRPGHFRGVATVVLKLFNMVQPDVAFFGRKDYQQVQVVRQMVADLNVPVTIRDCPTVREPDGLAMSSRNRYLSPAARRRALALWESLQLAQRMVTQGQRDATAIRAAMKEVLLRAEGQIDYIALADPQSLAEVAEVRGPTLAALAVRIDGTRLIDNAILE